MHNIYCTFFTHSIIFDATYANKLYQNLIKFLIEQYAVYCLIIKNFYSYFKFPYEAPYVVLLHNHLRIDEPKCIFEFHHPVKTQLGS